MSQKLLQPINDIVTNHKDLIFRICRAYAQSPIEPQDLFQEVIVQIWKSFPNFKADSKLSTWIYRVALNTCLRAKQRLDKQQDVIQLESVKIIQQEESEPKQSEEFEALQQCMFSLQDQDRSILLFSLEEMSYKEIAEITGLTENHIAVKMKRIRERMYRCITERLNKEEGV